jgi:hypothetical protein
MIASDDLYGGGSTSSKETTADDRLLAPSSDEDNSAWKSFYNGLYRCNFALEAISAMDDDLFTGDNKVWYLGQAHFMRGFYLWELAERWETFPLTLSTEVENMPKATVDEIYAAIADDLTQAINLIPANTAIPGITTCAAVQPNMPPRLSWAAYGCSTRASTRRPKWPVSPRLR